MKKTEKATFANGCFWCTEAIFKRLKGIISVEPGYSGGARLNPSYDEVCSGVTGHAEALQIVFDPTVISYRKVLDVFWSTHDPTTLNRQGNDIGTQYRSVIFYTSSIQKKIAEDSKAKLEKEKRFKGQIVTAIEPLDVFYPAENYHKDYYDNNREQGYCRVIIDPKIQKFIKEFKKDLKT